MEQRILIVCGQEIIQERNDGGKKCSYRNYELFQQVFGKENVYLCMLTNKYFDCEEHIIRMLSYKTIIDRTVNILGGNLFTSAVNENKIVDLIEEHAIDIVVFERSMYGSIIKKIKKRNLHCRIWVFVHNIEKNYFENKVKHQSKLFYLPFLKIAKSEKETFEYTDYIITLTHRDSDLLEEYYGRKGDLILPMTFSDCFDISKYKNNHDIKSKQIIFIGTMFPPNFDGIKWFVDNVMPELPEYNLQIIGKNFELKKSELERENVTIIGTVESLEEYYYADNIMVMPIFYGDGMKIKTAEAMMYGKTILASDEALEGYDVENVKGIFRCNDKNEFVATIKRIFSGNDYQYREEVRSLFLKSYCLDRQIETCRALWEIESRSEK